MFIFPNINISHRIAPMISDYLFKKKKTRSAKIVALRLKTVNAISQIAISTVNVTAHLAYLLSKNLESWMRE